MAKNNRLSRDQKRKAKLKKRAERSRSHESLAYAGNKYKTAELTPFIFRTEVGIYEAYVMSELELTDNDVEASLEQMIIKMRNGTMPSLPGPESGTAPHAAPDDEEFVVWNILQNWRIYAEEKGLPAKDDLIGVLRTILSSIEVWRAKNMHPQGYYRFLKDFMPRLGVNVQIVKSSPTTLPAPEGGAPGADDETPSTDAPVQEDHPESLR